jgi:hypothetical protein
MDQHRTGLRPAPDKRKEKQMSQPKKQPSLTREQSIGNTLQGGIPPTSHRTLTRFRCQLWADGSWRIETLGVPHTLLLERVGHDSVRLVETMPEHCREIVVSPHRRAAAWVLTTVQRVGNRITRSIETRYANGTVRTDGEEVRDGRIVRQSTWRFRNGASARAKYSAGQRVVEYLDLKGTVRQRTESKYTPTPTGFRVQTRGQSLSSNGASTTTDVSNSDVTVIGATQNQPGTVIMWGAGPGGSAIVNTMTPGADGTITTTFATAGNGMSVAGGWVMSTSGGDISRSGVIQTADGTNVFAESFSPSTGVNSQGVAGTNESGGFFTLFETTDLSGNKEQSSFSADGSGNSSETTVDTNVDGSFTITIDNTSSDGTTTSESQSYDSNGNLTGSSSSGSGSGGTGDTGLGGTGDDPGGPAPSDGSMPSDDGTDETPKGRFRGAGDTTFHQLFGSDATPSLTGGLGPDGQLVGSSRPVHDTGDPAASLQQSIEPNPEDSGSEGPTPGATAPAVKVFIMLPTATDDWGNLNNPRALVGAAAQFLGAQSTALVGQVLRGYEKA